MITFRGLGTTGRLGNQLWQIAATYAIAQRTNQPVVFPTWDYEPFFKVPSEWFVPSVPKEAVDAHTTRFVEHLDPRARPYLQDLSLIKGYEHEIRSMFQPVDLAVSTASSLFAVDGPKCAVHVRRGDNAYDPGTPDKHLYHPMPNDRYYEMAVEQIPADVHMVVFSDDINWCLEHMPDTLDRSCSFFYGGDPRPKEHEPDYKTAPIQDWIDLVGMTLCDSHIISNSTFSWWGAFLSNDVSPVYPSPWYGPRLDHVDASLMFPPTWRKIEYT